MIGTNLAHYRITGELGTGGMGVVYRAADTKLGREVALKVLPAEMASSPERLDRFRREAMMLASLDHPGVVSVYSVEESDGRHFLTMQLVEGESLDRLIPDDGMPLEQLLLIASQVTEGLAAAHDRGIVHRDLKPANIMVSGDSRVKVLDFGLAKVAIPQPDEPLNSEMETALHTREGVIMGTAPYMSPEQVSGRAVDLRTDIFSFGIMLYEMASGRRPFEGASTAELGSAILRDTPRALTTVRDGLPEGLARVIARCLEKEPDARFQSMREVQAALQDVSSDEKGPLTVPPRRSRTWSKPLPMVAAVAALAIALFLLVQFGVMGPIGTGQKTAARPEIRSIAVLPLDNFSGDPSQEYFAEGMTDALTADLARISQIRVISRGSAMQFGGENRPSTPEIARVLDVDAIVEGSVLKEGDRVRITAQLIDARADRHLWAETFDRSSKDVLALQGEMAAAIAREINVQLTPAEQSQLGSAKTVDPEAYDAYLKGRYFFFRPSDENLQKAIGRFEDALAISPNFVPALSGLSDAYLWAGYNEGFMTASDARPKAKAAAEKAIGIDSTSAEGHTSLAVFKHFYEYDWEAAEAAYHKAFELNPNYAFAHDQFSLCLAFQGRYEESIAESARAAELDPLNPQILIDSIFAHAWSGDIEGAKEQARRAEEIDPTFFFPAFSYGWIDIQAGKVGDAIEPFQKAKTMGAPAFVSAWLSYAYGASGDRDRAMAEVEDLTNMSLNRVVTPFDNALVALGLGENARAVSLLEQAYALDSQWLGWLKNDRIFDPLRLDPRFAELMKKLNFED